MQIESANFDVGVVTAMKTGKNAIQNFNKQINVDDIADLKDELDDMMAENQERQDYFAGIAQDGNDELLGELDEWEAEAAEKELQEMDINPQPIINKPKPIINKPKPVVIAAQEEEEDEEAELAKMMMA